MSSSSLEERAQAVAATSQAELEVILPHLRQAIRDHIHYYRALAVEIIPEAFGNESKAAA